MNTFVTVLTVQYPQQLWIIKGRLESEGIQCFVKDELTVQANNLYSNAVGGVKLQVQQQDADEAIKILKELGYIKDEPVAPDLLTRFDSKKKKIPLLKRLSPAHGITLVLLVFVTLLTTVLYFIFRPSLYDSLTSNIWCIDKIEFRNTIVGPRTLDPIIAVSPSGNTDCYENIGFWKNHIIVLPGLNSNSLRGDWKMAADNEIVITADSLKVIFDGIYKGDVTNDILILKSKTTLIQAHIDRFQMSQ